MLVSHPAPPTPLRLVLVDDHEMVLHGLDTDRWVAHTRRPGHRLAGQPLC